MSNPLQPSLFAPVLDAIANGERKIKTDGLWGASEAFLLSHIARQGRPFCLVAPSHPQAERIYQELCFFLGLYPTPPGPYPTPMEVRFFPPWDILPYEPATPRPDLIAQRLATLHRLAHGGGVCVVTSVEAFLQKVISKAALHDKSQTLKKGQEISKETLMTSLCSAGYETAEPVTQPGEASFRGGIIDLYPPASPHPVRIELFGDQIESLRLFDPESQRSIKAIDAIHVMPGREDLTDPCFYQTPLSDYLSSDTLLIFDEPDEVIQKGRRFLEEAADNALFGQRNSKYPKVGDLCLPLSHLSAAGVGRTIIDLESLSLRQEAGAKRFTFDSHSLPSLGLGQPGQPFSEVVEVINILLRDHFVMLVATSENQLTRFQHLFSDHDLPWVRSEEEGEVHHSSAIALKVGTLYEGFSLPRMKVAFLTEEALTGGTPMHRREAKNARSMGRALLASFEELKTGDYIVHLHHGIGRYIGLKRLSIRQQERGPAYDADFLVLEYAGRDKVYVPLDAVNLISRYIGPEGNAPQLDPLGGVRWAKAKERVRGKIREMTQELLKLYAEREIAAGHPFSTPSSLAEAFSAAFEYEETPDQLTAIEEVISDMQRPKPMDRLICGDVGYGKTEVAIRAAFHAVMDNKQVAVLAPTTLLVQQHYQTFSKRFSPYPVKVGMLSRFNSRQEQRATIADLKRGGVDILIGTHRMLQKDIAFLDLGLLVIDEEHRFGVRHKERFKQMKKQIDVLTLTATPIPRTLQMSLAQMRDLSTIETAPAHRLSIRTILAPFDPNIIREAIFRELVRGGQIFFVHNRVQQIAKIGEFLAHLVPEARIGIAHGQMREALLEEVMLKFITKEYNLLVSTAIIESGLDIPSANTIIINDADRFGLADLYQLRGRVGRSEEQAYAYLLVREGKILTEESRQRLKSIQEFTELGSGFRIAARDLEIRGAGNLLGGEQSGYIRDVGLELYMKMIEAAVRELKGTPLCDEVEPELRLMVSAYIPEEYVPDTCQRLSIYKRLSAGGPSDEIEPIRCEMKDRYGPLPDVAEHLLQVTQLKRMAKSVHLLKIEEGDKTLSFLFDSSAEVNEDHLKKLVSAFGGRLHFTSSHAFEITIRDGSWRDHFLDAAFALSILKGEPT